jgi:ferredoxin-nitrite reductase
MSSDFSPDQKRYLEGSVSGLSASRVSRAGAPAKPEPVGPDAIHFKAQDRTVAAGGKLNDQEKLKRDEHPFDAYPRLVRQAENNEAPKPQDNFRWRYYGIFYVAPTQASYMCRLRIPNGILKHWQFAGVADLAENFGGPYAHVTTRANLQLREIEPKNAINVIEGLQDLGLCSRGSGADNIRNVTGTSTAGIDPQEILDTRRYAREWHFHILNDRSLYGLPRSSMWRSMEQGASRRWKKPTTSPFRRSRWLMGLELNPAPIFAWHSAASPATRILRAIRV